MRFFEVGGCVRDRIMGVKTKDIDFAVEMGDEDIDVGFPCDPFQIMVDELRDQGFEIFVETPEFLTIRAHFPRDHEEFGKTTADFVLCRKDGPSSDNRRPDFVEPGTIFDDLARRDFTMNAIAIELGTDTLIDPHNGVEDIKNGVIRFVGDPMERIEEDALRALRAIRFKITKGFVLHRDTAEAINKLKTADLLETISLERVREELVKMFKHDTMKSMAFLEHHISRELRDAIFRSNTLRLVPTLGGK